MKYEAIKCRFIELVARKPAFPWQPFSAPLVGGRPQVSSRVWSWCNHQ